jgi:hypothetical protein
MFGSTVDPATPQLRPDGKLLAIVSQDGGVATLRLPDGKTLQRFETRRAPLGAEMGSRVLTASASLIKFARGAIFEWTHGAAFWAIAAADRQCPPCSSSRIAYSMTFSGDMEAISEVGSPREPLIRRSRQRQTGRPRLMLLPLVSAPPTAPAAPPIAAPTSGLPPAVRRAVHHCAPLFRRRSSQQ